jgi:hypothetical protein
MRARRPLLSAIVLASAVLALMPDPALACAERTFSVQLSDYVISDVAPFYYSEEGTNDSAPEFVISAVGQVCPPNESGQVDYNTSGGTATASPVALLGDYQAASGTATFATNSDRREEVQVTMHEDSVAETGVAETFHVSLSNVRGFGANAGSPMTAPFFIVDDEGDHRARFVFGSTSIQENREVFDPDPIKIPVLRAGPASGQVTFSVSPSNGEVTPADGTVDFRPDGRMGFVEVHVHDDDLDEPDEDFTISLGGASIEGGTFRLNVDDNDLPGGGDEDQIAPATSFHHPKHGDRLAKGSFRADTIHAFVSERPDHRVNQIDWARIGLRKKKTNNNCSWWGGNSWQGGPCGQPKWLQPTEEILNYSTTRALYTYTEYPSLRPSQGTRIKSYGVYVRASDVAGNVSRLDVGQSVAIFEVIRR